MHKSTRWVRRLTALVAIAVPISFIASAVRDFGQSTHVPQKPFDSLQWRLAGFEDDGDYLHTNRQSMINDLAFRVLPGSTKEQIEELLGTSPTYEEMPRYHHKYGWDLAYYIGDFRTPDPLFLGEWEEESELLFIRLDEEQCFESWYLFGAPNWSQVLASNAKATFRRYR